MKWQSALGKLDASSAGTLQKYLLIAFDIETGWWRVLPLTCKLSIMEDRRFLFIINVIPHFLTVCGVFKYAIVVYCTV